MKLVYALLSLKAAIVQAKSSGSISSLEEFWIFIAVVYAAVLVPLLGYFLYSIVSDPATGQVLTVMWARVKQQTFAFLGPSTAARQPQKETKKGR